LQDFGREKNGQARFLHRSNVFPEQALSTRNF